MRRVLEHRLILVILVTVPRLLLDNPAPAQQNVTTLQGAGG